MVSSSRMSYGSSCPSTATGSSDVKPVHMTPRRAATNGRHEVNVDGNRNFTARPAERMLMNEAVQTFLASRSVEQDLVIGQSGVGWRVGTCEARKRAGSG